MLPWLEQLHKITRKMKTLEKVPFQSYLCTLIQSYTNAMFTIWTCTCTHSPHTHTHIPMEGWKHLRACISNLRHQIKFRNEKMHQNSDGSGFHLGALKGEWGTSPVRHSFPTNNRSNMSYWINKCVCST